MHTPEISVIMPAYNSALWLGQAVESILLQEGPAWELLIVDDASSDDTKTLAARYAYLDGRIRMLDNQGVKGAGGARNTGLQSMSGRSVLFLDSDDALCPGALESLHAALKRDGKPVALGGKKIFCEQRWLAMNHAADQPGESFAPMGFSFCQHLFQANFLHEHGINFPEDLIISQDSAFLAEVYARLHEPPPRTDASVFLYRINHKPQRPGAAKSLAFIRRFFLALDTFSKHGKRNWIVPYLENYFLPEWLFRLHAVAQADEAEAPAYLAACLDLLRPLLCAPSAVLRGQLGPAANDFLAMAANGDPHDLLDVLERNGLVRPLPHFIGIDKDPEKPGWRWYRFSRRASNVARLAESRRALAYLAMLQRSSRRRLNGRGTEEQAC